MSPVPLVSVVLPTYNGSPYLDQTIQSCLRQTYAHLELIVVDDASTDDTANQVEHYGGSDVRVRLIRHKTNRGLPAALNTGFSFAQGEYYTWISDDNCFRPEALAQMVAVLKCNPMVDVVYSDYSIIDESGRCVERVVVGEPEILLVGNAVGPSFLYRSKVQEQTGHYSESLFLAEDYDFWLRASKSFRFEPLHKDLYLYRRHNASLTALNREPIKRATEVAILRNLPHMTWPSAAQLSTAYMRAAERAQERQDWKGVVAYLFQAVRHSPSHFYSKALRLGIRTVMGKLR
jgi:glycosyltransferase involved in cell wall biosynthesis